MLKRYYITITALLLFCAAHSQDQNLFCEQLQALEKMVKTHHFKPKAVNDSLSTHVFDLFITTLDEDKRLFTQDDIDNFEADRYALDDYVQNKTCDFINNYITRLSNALQILKLLLAI